MQIFIFVRVLIFVVVIIARKAFCEDFTAMIHMEKFLKTGEFLTTILEKYITEMEGKLTKLKWYVGKFSEDRHPGVIRQQYLFNPVNAFRLTKRLTRDWYDIQSIIKENTGKKLLDDIRDYYQINGSLSFPTEEDLKGASAAIIRLQSVYNLESSSLARNEINGVKYGNQLLADDCFQLGKQCYENGDYVESEIWFREAMNRYREETKKSGDQIDIFEYLIYSYLMLGDLSRCLEITDKLLEISPQHQEAEKNKAFLESAVLEIKSLESKRDRDDVIMKMSEKQYADYSKRKSKYHKLCRNEIGISEKVRAALKCRYVDFGRPFLKLAKVKEEELYLNPRIVMYHDVLTDNEIEIIKQLSVSKLERATAFNGKTKKYEPVDYRIGKSAWLENSLHPSVEIIEQRVEDITGLSMETSELLQIVNYGIGGQYEPHFDISFSTDKGESDWGKRLATFLFYMNDVSQGGATIFPSLKLSVKPKKGSALLWYNIKRDGKPDLLLRHASCPVLLGSKWIGTKWIHEKNQEFRRPCGLIEDEL